VVLAGTPGRLGATLQVTDLPVRGLPPAVRAALERGVPISAASLPQALQQLRAGRLPQPE